MDRKDINMDRKDINRDRKAKTTFYQGHVLIPF